MLSRTQYNMYNIIYSNTDWDSGSGRFVGEFFSGVF